MRPDPIAVLPMPVTGRPRAPEVPRPERWTLRNGLRVVALPRAGVPQIAMRLVVPGGSAADPMGFPGCAGMVASLLTEGTATQDAREINARIDSLGASFTVHAGHDFAEVEMTLLADTLAEAVPLLADIVSAARFPVEEVERVRAEALDALEARLDEPSNVADDRIAREVFGDHPYGTPSFGTGEGVAAVPRELLVAFHGERFRPFGSTLVVAGPFDTSALRTLLDAAFDRWIGSAEPVRVAAPPIPAVMAGERVDIPWKGSSQAEIRVGGVGLARNHPDWIPATLANHVLGGSTILGRLGSNLREEKGWTYGVRSGFSAGLAPAGWGVETAVDGSVRDAAVREILEEARRMTTEPVGEDELRRAKDALILSLPRAFETAPRVAGRFATVEAYALSPDYWERLPERIEAVGPEVVMRISREHFDPSRLVVVTTGGSGSSA